MRPWSAIRFLPRRNMVRSFAATSRAISARECVEACVSLGVRERLPVYDANL